MWFRVTCFFFVIGFFNKFPRAGTSVRKGGGSTGKDGNGNMVRHHIRAGPPKGHHRAEVCAAFGCPAFPSRFLPARVRSPAVGAMFKAPCEQQGPRGGCRCSACRELAALCCGPRTAVGHVRIWQRELHEERTRPAVQEGGVALACFRRRRRDPAAVAGRRPAAPVHAWSDNRWL